MRQKLGSGQWRDLGPSRATTAAGFGGTAIEPVAARPAPTRRSTRWVAIKDTTRAHEVAIEVNECGSVMRAAAVLGITRQRINQLVRRA